MKILEVKNLNISYYTDDGLFDAVKDMNFSIDERDAIGIVGESGSGKSTFALSVLDLLPKNQAKVTGQILYRGTDLLSLSEKELNKIRWDEISFVFQKSMSALSPVHTIGDQLYTIYRVHDKKTRSKVVKENLLKILETVNLRPEVYNQYPHELSGGMLQRCSIALSLINDPEIVIFDEATTALDVVVQEQILDMIMDLEDEFNLTRIMITHDISVVSSTCNKVIVMKDGEIKEMGRTEEVLLNPQHEYTKELLEAYINIV